MAPENKHTVLRTLEGLHVVDRASKLHIDHMPFVEVDSIFLDGEEGALGLVVVSTKDKDNSIILKKDC